MNAATELTNFLPTRSDWDVTFAEVNSWRGSCLHHFSMVEMAVTETLLDLSTAPTRVGAFRLRQLIGQRFQDLMAAIGPDGSFHDAGHDAFIALSLYRENQEAFRALLCQGAIKSTINPHGKWTLVIRSLSVRARQSERGLVVIDQLEAQTRLASLKRDGQKLASMLGQLRKKIMA